MTFSMDTGVIERTVSTLIKALRVQTSEVKSPSKRNRPHPTATVARIKVNVLTSCRAIQGNEPKPTSAAPATTRSKNSPTPGAPSGKIEKVDRSVSLVNHKSLDGFLTKRIPTARSLFVPLSWYSRSASELNNSATHADGDRLGSVARA